MPRDEDFQKIQDKKVTTIEWLTKNMANLGKEANHKNDNEK